MTLQERIAELEGKVQKLQEESLAFQEMLERTLHTVETMVRKRADDKRIRTKTQVQEVQD